MSNPVHISVPVRNEFAEAMEGLPESHSDNKAGSRKDSANEDGATGGNANKDDAAKEIIHRNNMSGNNMSGSSVTRSDVTRKSLNRNSAIRDPASAHMAVTSLSKSYRKAKVEIPVLKQVDMHVDRGEFLSIVGQSGSGKSTLLHLMGTLDSPDSGEVIFNSHRIDNLPSAGRDLLRNKYFGMVFQFYHLLPELTTLENVLVPLMIRQGAFRYFRQRRQHKEQARELLSMVGLSHRLKHRPRELSGGEMQRAAIARALVSQPELLLADEPTGNLDQGTGHEIMELLRTLNREQGLTIVMVTHDHQIARDADRVVRLVEGQVVADQCLAIA